MRALLLLCALSLAGAQVKNPDTFTYLTIGDPDSLDPAWSYDSTSHHIIANVYEFLLAYKPGSLKELEPRIAAKVPARANGLISADGRSYTFPIRKGVKFHDGKDLTADDVRYSLLRFMLYDRDGGPSPLLLEPVLGVLSTRDAQGKPLDGLYAKAEKAVRVEGDKVVVTLTRPFAPFLGILASYGAIVSKDWVAANGGWDGTEAAWVKHSNPRKQDSPLHERENGSGPYALERLDRRSKETILARFDGYWRGPAPLKRVVIKLVDEFATRKLMLQAGDADVIYAPQMMYGQLSEVPGVELIDGLENLESPTTLFFTYKINPVGNPNIGSGRLDGEGIPPDFFDDRDVRLGFASSIDYDAYIRDVMRGKGHRAHGYLAKGLVGYDEKNPSYAFDLKKAEEHFKKAWGGKLWEKGFTCTLMFNDNQPNILTLTNMIKKNIESLNPKFKLDIRTVQWSTYLEQTQGHKIPVFIGMWMGDYPDAHNFAFNLLHSQGYFAGKSSFANKDFDALIDQAVGELDGAKREKLYRKLDRLAFDFAPSIPIAGGFRFRTQRKWVKGFKFSPVFPDSPYGSYFFDLKKQG
ncbi:MAG: ABC transporter substrate-binding protein [Elusimicrobia bacterium]|nr:ABC transporter substrate-binding protein [Elusimicrobiota bacterium]